MGLDISVYKPIKVEYITDSMHYYIISQNPELEIFKHLAVEKENSYYNIEAELNKLGLKESEVKFCSFYGGNDAEFKFIRKDNNEQITLINPEFYLKKELCIAVYELGYQRKGANKLFYEKGIWDSPFILDSKTLKKHWKLYFSAKTPDSPGGFASCTEYDLTNAEMKSNFKKNIIDKFVQGETFVVYH